MALLTALAAAPSVLSSVSSMFGPTAEFMERQEVRDNHYMILLALRSAYGNESNPDWFRNALKPVIDYHTAVVARGATKDDLIRIQADYTALQNAKPPTDTSGVLPALAVGDKSVVKEIWNQNKGIVVLGGGLLAGMLILGRL